MQRKNRKPVMYSKNHNEAQVSANHPFNNIERQLFQIQLLNHFPLALGNDIKRAIDHILNN